MVYLPNGGAGELKLTDMSDYSVELYNPREGGALKKAPAQKRGDQLLLQSPAEAANEDWLFVVKKTNRAIEPR